MTVTCAVGAAARTPYALPVTLEYSVDIESSLSVPLQLASTITFKYIFANLQYLARRGTSFGVSCQCILRLGAATTIDARLLQEAPLIPSALASGIAVSIGGDTLAVSFATESVTVLISFGCCPRPVLEHRPTNCAVGVEGSEPGQLVSVTEADVHHQ